MIKNIFFIIIGFLLGVFLTSSLSWRDIDWNNLKHNPWQEIVRLRTIVTEKPKMEAHALVVTQVINGDTVLVEGGKEVKLLGISADGQGEPCYNAAKKRLQELVLGQKVNLIKDINDKDSQGNLLRYLTKGKMNINIEMVKEGLVALRITNDVTLYKTALQAAEQLAKLNHRGCKWKNSD